MPFEALEGPSLLLEGDQREGDRVGEFTVHEVHVARPACGHHMQAVQHGFPDGQAIPFRAMQGKIDVMTAVETGKRVPVQDVRDDVDMRHGTAAFTQGFHGCRSSGSTADLEGQFSAPLRKGLRKGPQSRFGILAVHA